MECFESYETFFILQVLSRTTASGLESQGRHDTSGTVKFLRMIDRVFDCLNVSHFNQNTKGKPECKEYRDVNDWRFEVLIYFMLIICNISWHVIIFLHSLTNYKSNMSSEKESVFLSSGPFVNILGI